MNIYNMHSNQILREEQIKNTRETMYRTHGLKKSSFINTIKSIWYLTFGYFTDYNTHLVYVDTLYFIMKKQKQKEENNNIS